MQTLSRILKPLVIEITRAVRRLGLTQEEAGRRMGIAQPRASGTSLASTGSGEGQQKRIHACAKLASDPDFMH